MENSVGFLEAARDDRLPDGYFCIEGIETMTFKTARNSADEAYEALEELEVKYGLQGEIGVVR